MEKSDIIAHLSNYVEELSSATRLGTYSIPRLGRSALLGESQSKTTRGNTPWKMAQYVVIPTTKEDKSDISGNLQPYLDGWRGLMSSHGNQFLILEVAPGIWQMFNCDGEYMGDNDFILSYIPDWDKQHDESPAPSIHKINEPLQQIFYGAPGTGKSFAIDNLTNDENTVRTTFHPDSDYASFVGAYKPTMEDVPINSIYGESVQYATGKNGHPGTEKKIVYKYVPQAFLKAYVAAWSDLDNPHYLVIEEINRGNCAQIFGDLFQLLDRNSHGSSSYAIHADDDIRQFLATDSKGFGNLSEEQKQAIADFVLVKDNGKRSVIGPKILSGELLLLPPNLRIWATMNTSDQSLFPIDSAFKRRWNWHYVPIEYNKKYWLLHIGDNYYRWGDFLKAINPIISELTESADKQMGYFFAKPDEKHGVTTENNTISEDVFINKVLFYLWTDVLKDFDAGKEPFLNPDTKRAYEFSDFFDAKHDYLEQFVGKLNITPVANEDIESNTANTEEASKRIYGRSLVIKFPDGTVIKGDSQFDSYIQALEKIGLDKAAAVVEKKGYSRNQAPLISKEKHASIENSPTFSYVQNGDYYIIKGIDTMEGTLKGISKELGLNLDVYFE